MSISFIIGIAFGLILPEVIKSVSKKKMHKKDVCNFANRDSMDFFDYKEAKYGK